MTPASPSVATPLARIWRDLQPFDGRLALTWRIALLCALVTGVAMTYRIPEAAISCYLVIFLMKPDAAMNCLLGVGLIALASLVVLAMIPVINLSIDSPPARLAIIFFATYIFLFLASATPLGEQAAIVGLIIAFIMTLVTDVPVGQIGDQGLLAAWKMACMPMALMVLLNLVVGTPPHVHVRRRIVNRLRTAAEALETPGHRADLDDLLAAGNDASLQQVLLARLLHLTPRQRTTWLNGAVETSYKILLVADASPQALPPERRSALARLLRGAAERISAGERPEPPPAASVHDDTAEGALMEALSRLSRPDGGASPVPESPPLLAADAFSSPRHQRYALKTSVAAVICYLVYTAAGWDGIHTALITCYVAALGTTGETLYKLTLRLVGCLIGAAMGCAALIFVMPNLTSIGGLMVLVFAAVMVAAWVSTGSERISYAGVQIALAFLLTTLNGFGPSFDFSQASDRIMGILLGIFVIYVIFTQFWPASVVDGIRTRLQQAAAALASLATTAPGERQADVRTAAEIQKTFGETGDLLAMAFFEPRRQRASDADLRHLAALRAELKSLCPQVRFAPALDDTLHARLHRLAGDQSGGTRTP
jgi:multidrug resistance protein MdtO